jgi:hypothetical protein
MKIYVHYDSEGTIRSLVTAHAPKGAGAMLTPKAGYFVAEVEGLKFKGEAPTHEELAEIARTHKVSLPGPRCVLTKKS